MRQSQVLDSRAVFLQVCGVELVAAGRIRAAPDRRRQAAFDALPNALDFEPVGDDEVHHVRHRGDRRAEARDRHHGVTDRIAVVDADIRQFEEILPRTVPDMVIRRHLLLPQRARHGDDLRPGPLRL